MYASWTLQTHERGYGTSELDAVGVVWAVQYFRQYISGHPCTVYMDHEAFKSLSNIPQPSGELARWGSSDLGIQYCPRKTNAQADALSYHPVPMAIGNCSKTQTPALIAAMESPLSPAQSEEPVSEETTLGEQQWGDPHPQKLLVIWKMESCLQMISMASKCY